MNPPNPEVETRAGVVVAIASDDDLRRDLVDVLQRRYGVDYEVVGVSGDDVAAAAGLGPVVVALAPIGTPDFDGLQTVTTSHPMAKRIAVVGVGDTSVADSLGKALTLNQVDYYLGHPWATPEEEVYPVVSEALRVSAKAREIRLDKATIVDAHASGRGRQLADWLNRNGVPARLRVADSDEGAALIDGPLAGVALPAVVLWNGSVIVDPADDELAEALGASTRPTGERYDIAVVGAGPAGLAAAVYAASEGLRAVVIEGNSIGGQAATSSKIRNYLGFPWGVSGADLAGNASRQAEQLGAEFIVARQATALALDGDDRVITLSNGDQVRSSSVVIAGGVSYRRLGIPSVDDLVGNGVFYGAGAAEASSMGGLRSYVVGAGNSAGQAAAHMAAAGADVTLLVRGDSLAKSMSAYLVEQLTGTPNVTVRTSASVAEAHGDHHLTGLTITDRETDETELVDADALFVFIGAQPHTEWLQGTIDLDDRGFVLTGRSDATWLETSMPMVFAAGDIRDASIKRVAAAVGEGSSAALLALEALRPD